MPVGAIDVARAAASKMESCQGVDESPFAMLDTGMRLAAYHTTVVRHWKL
jgi:hypothetical protein